ncbi:MAG: hypothetical protein D4R84_11450 [Rhodocyclaceae bacterium]|nr:MAG: hypothetical protein D4R84_11450 [Rhodocyclaceae bacterium]
MQLPITVKLQASRNLVLLLVASHMGALLAVSVIELLVWIKLALLLLIVMSFWNCQKLWYGARRINFLTLRDEGVLDYSRVNGETGQASIHPQSTVTPPLTVILLRRERRLEALVLLPDALDQDDYRRLRLWLRWRSADN